jgi:hypothetical protein
VGADGPGHLRELLDALDLEVDASAVHRYRALLRSRNSRQSA